jgi:hypothetical protein
VELQQSQPQNGEGFNRAAKLCENRIVVASVGQDRREISPRSGRLLIARRFSAGEVHQKFEVP